MYEVEYFDGVLDVYYATMKTQETATAPPVYDKPEVLGSSIDVSISATYREGKLNASNVTKRNKKMIDTYTVKLNVDKIPPDVLAKIMGRRVDEKGVQHINGNAVAPNVAIGFACTLDLGGREFWWMYKGTFAELAKSAKTAGDKVEYQTPSIEGVFVRRQDNDDLAIVVEVSATELRAGKCADWFDAVYLEGNSGQTEETPDP